MDNTTKMPAETAPPRLTRALGLTALTLYGIGDMLGAGIYALVGKVAGVMGNAVWLAFLVSTVAALLTGLSYASLGSRYPRAAGAAYITHRAYRWPFFSYLIGLAVMASGLTSMATQSRAFSGYFSGLVSHVPAEVLIVAFVLALSFINFWGIRESSWLNLVCTLIEVAGLGIVIVVAAPALGSVNYLTIPRTDGDAVWPILLSGSVLTFYAFLGFEDMINVIEEVRDPRRTFPRALVLALAATTVIYLLVSLSAVSVVAYETLAASKQPLVDVVRAAAPRFPAALFSLIALFAITNTALLNYIMGSRLAYGMARQGLLPARLGRIHPRRHTPHVAIAALRIVVLVLALSGDLTALAQATSALLLAVFIVINAALLILKNRPGEPPGQFEVPSFVPAGGIVVCLLILFHVKTRALAIAGILLLAIVLLYALMRPKALTEEQLAEMED